MDKSDYLVKAPTYYALGLAVALSRLSRVPLTIQQINEALSIEENYLHKPRLIDRGAEILRESGVIDIIRDDFGSTLFISRPALEEWISGDAARSFALFQRFKDISGNVSWLLAALTSVNERYFELGIEDTDFDLADAGTQWEPIPLDREDEGLQKTTEALDTAIAEIEGDNGYAVHAPGEREYVLNGLKVARKILSENIHIYWMQIDSFALKPLQLVVNRFGSAAVGMAASAARAALVEWLKNKIGHFLG